MTGHIPGTTVLRGSPKAASQLRPGSNHVALRAANERLVLSLIRAHGQLSKAQIADLSGLTAQTASVITNSLIEAGLLLAGTPIRGKIGQPSVPLSLNPDGATFLGVHIEKAEMRAALVNFTGQVIAEKSNAASTPDLGQIIRFVKTTAQRLRPADAKQRGRFQGIGISFASGSLDGDRTRLPWQQVEEELAELGEALHVATYASSDAVAACCAELIYGLGSGMANFLYVFVDEAVSGGLVRDGHIQFARDDKGANLGKVLVPNGAGRMVTLRDFAADSALQSPGQDATKLLASGIAHAVTAAASVVPCRTVILDGSIEANTLQQLAIDLRASLAQIGSSEAIELAIREGSRHRKSIALGAACLPLADRFYPAETIGATLP